MEEKHTEANKLMADLPSVIEEIARRRVVYFVGPEGEAPVFVLCPYALGKRVLGLYGDPEYGWPRAVILPQVESVEAVAPGPKHRFIYLRDPFRYWEEECLAVGIHPEEYEEIKRNLGHDRGLLLGTLDRLGALQTSCDRQLETLEKLALPARQRTEIIERTVGRTKWDAVSFGDHLRHLRERPELGDEAFVEPLTRVADWFGHLRAERLQNGILEALRAAGDNVSVSIRDKVRTELEVTTRAMRATVEEADWARSQCEGERLP